MKKSSGKCLCGALSWRVTGSPRESSHCHCGMCRKAHGASFATWYFYDASSFEWTGATDSLRWFRSSNELTRAFCRDCGAMAPCCSDEGDTWFVPSGSHQDGPDVESHIFVGSKAPWIELHDDLPKHHGYPEGESMSEFPDKPMAPAIEGVIRGSCLCDKVAFEITAPFQVIHNCHCSRCRQSRAAAFATNGFTSANGLRFVRGEGQLLSFKPADAKRFTHAFCRHCGSSMPRLNQRLNIAMVPLGALDDDPELKPQDHIYTVDKVHWWPIEDGLVQFEGAPD